MGSSAENMGTCRLDEGNQPREDKASAKGGRQRVADRRSPSGDKRKGKSTEARHRDGLTRKSEELW